MLFRSQGLGMAVADKKIIEVAINEMTAITGQKAVATISRKDIANFKLRKKMPIGVMVTLRRERMYEFLEKLVRVALPRIRDFKGIEQTYQPQGELPELPRLGAVFTVDGGYDKLSWYGRGPWESYPDRKSSTSIGRWNSTVAEQYTHYPRPQDSGNHEEVSEVVLTNKKGEGIRITALETPFSFSALPYTAKEISEATHDYQLKPREETILSIDAAVLGLGNSSCGPGVLKKYAIDKSKIHTLKIRISNL